MAPSLATNIVSPIILLIGTFLCGTAPILVRRTLLHCGCNTPQCKPSCKARKGKVITSFLIYLGGGVLLATCLVHLLPETREGFEHSHEHAETKTDVTSSVLSTVTTPSELYSTESNVGDDHDKHEHHHHHDEFPMPEFVVCCGFFAVYLVEEVIHLFLGHGHSHIPTESKAIRSFSRSGSCRYTPHGSDPVPTVPAVPIIPDDNAKGNDANGTAMVMSDKFDSECQLTPSDADNFSVTGLLTVAALSFHSLFEGFAIGLQSTDSGLWILLAAVAVHKLVIAFVVGLEVLSSGGKDRLVVIYMSVFAAMSPLGMVIAMITQAEVEEGAPMTIGILNGIATGTLLYVTFCEILQREEASNTLKGWQQFVATFVGFGIMCFVQYLSSLA